MEVFLVPVLAAQKTHSRGTVGCKLYAVCLAEIDCFIQLSGPEKRGRSLDSIYLQSVSYKLLQVLQRQVAGSDLSYQAFVLEFVHLPEIVPVVEPASGPVQVKAVVSISTSLLQHCSDMNSASMIRLPDGKLSSVSFAALLQGNKNAPSIDLAYVMPFHPIDSKKPLSGV